MNQTIMLSVLFLKEGDTWVGQCLEHDIAAQGKTFAAAKSALTKTIAGQIFLDGSRGQSGLSAIKPAPDYYRQKFDGAEPLRGELQIRVSDKMVPVAEDVRVALV
jgi:hypothetical protein